MGTLRLLLALSVAIDHAGGLFGYLMIGGVSAVQTFYLISGFLIAHILSTKYPPDTWEGRWLFYSNRALRIFVPYWFVLAATIAACLVSYWLIGDAAVLTSWLDRFAGLNLPAKLFIVADNLLIFGQDASLWMMADGHLSFAYDPLMTIGNAIAFNIVAPAWSLALELTFYLVAPYLARCRTKTLVLIYVATQVARFSLYGAGLNNSALTYRFFPLELGLFVLGMLGQRLYQALAPLPERLTTPVTIAVLIAVLSLMHVATLRSHPHIFYIIVAVTLPSLFSFTKTRPWDRWLGELSYPLYLIHWPVEQIILATDPAALPTGGWFAVMSVAISMALSVLLLTTVITPLDRWRSQRVGTPQRLIAMVEDDPDSRAHLRPVPAADR